MKVSSKKPRAPARRRASSNPDLYVVPVSGGKDSQLVLSNAVREHGRERVVAVHHYTGIDHPLTMKHLDYMSEKYGVRIEHTVNPKYRDMYDLLDRRNMIPGRVARFCTHELKMAAFNHWLQARKDLRELMVLMGMRAPESTARAARYSEFSPDDVFSLRDLNPKKVPKVLQPVRVRLPIVDMSTGDVFATLRERGEEINPLYKRGHKRVGCFPCILGGKSGFVMAARDPVGRELIITLANFKDMLVLHKDMRDPDVLLDLDLDEILHLADNDPFGFYDDAADDPGCQWCAQ